MEHEKAPQAIKALQERHKTGLAQTTNRPTKWDDLGRSGMIGPSNPNHPTLGNSQILAQMSGRASRGSQAECAGSQVQQRASLGVWRVEVLISKKGDNRALPSCQRLFRVFVALLFYLFCL